MAADVTHECIERHTIVGELQLAIVRSLNGADTCRQMSVSRLVLVGRPQGEASARAGTDALAIPAVRIERFAIWLREVLSKTGTRFGDEDCITYCGC